MVESKYPVRLRKKERCSLVAITRKGEINVRVYRRARALLLANEGKTDEAIAKETDLTRLTVFNLRKRFQQERIRCVHDKARSGRPPSIDGVTRAKITALACSEAPEGYSQWSLRLLADKAVELRLVESIHRGTVGEILKKMRFNPNESAVGV